jgi:putative membrane protein (TIGR04086 family)
MSNRNNETGIFRLLKGVGFAWVFSFLSVVVFACVLRIRPCSDKTVYVVNQTIKGVAIVLASVLFVRGEKGWLKGMAVGGLFIALSYLTFAVVGGGFALSGFAFLELAIGLFLGAISGIVAVNLK